MNVKKKREMIQDRHVLGNYDYIIGEGNSSTKRRRGSCTASPEVETTWHRLLVKVITASLFDALALGGCTPLVSQNNDVAERLLLFTGESSRKDRVPHRIAALDFLQNLLEDDVFVHLAVVNVQRRRVTYNYINKNQNEQELQHHISYICKLISK